MSSAIHQYSLTSSPEQTINVHSGFRALSVLLANGALSLCGLNQLDQETHSLTVFIVNTDDELPEGALVFVGSVEHDAVTRHVFTSAYVPEEQ